MKHKNIKNGFVNTKFSFGRAMTACLVLFSMIICATASPITQTRFAATKSPAQPQPQVLDNPLDEEQLAALVERLKEVLAESVEDEDSQTAIMEKWDARMESLAGKTAKQVTNLLLADVKAIVKDAEAIRALTEGFNAAATAAEPTVETETEPETKTKTETETEPEPEPEPEPETNKPTTPPTNPTQPTGRPGANVPLRQYIRNLVYNPKTLMSTQADGGVLLVEKVTKSATDRTPGNRKITRCSRTTKNLTKNFDEVAILQPTQGVVYPGALVFADSELVDGKPRPLTGLPRAPIDLRLDLPGLEDEGSFTIANPTDGKVQSSLNKALNFWNNSTSFKNGYINSSRSSFNVTEAFSSEQLALGLGFNAKWASGDVSAQMNFSTSGEKNVVIAIYKQVFYTVTFDAPNTPEAFFDGSVTPDEAKEIFSATADSDTKDKLVPAYVSSVNYGRIIMLRMEADKSVTTADLKAAGNYVGGGFSGGANASMDFNKVAKNTTFTVITLGGNAEVASEAVSARKPEDLAAIIKGKNARYSKDNPGVPIAYTVKFVKDNAVAKMGTTTDYTTTDCKDLPNLWLTLRNNGAYSAHFIVNWDEPKPGTDPAGNQTMPMKLEQNHFTVGRKWDLEFPADATNIRVNLRTISGWEILNRIMLPDDLNRCIQTTGHAIGPNHDNKCER